MIDMGLGLLGGSTLVHKRKFRWTFEVTKGPCGLTVPPFFCKLASRPNLSVEEVEINFLNGKTWIPGKASWETITVTYYDIAGDDNIGLWNWLASVYNFTDPVKLQMGSARQDYAASVRINLYDGCGKILEAWGLQDVWPTAMNFGELDYGSSEEVVLELTLRYSNVDYQNFCGVDPTFCCQTDCTAGPGERPSQFRF